MKTSRIRIRALMISRIQIIEENVIMIHDKNEMKIILANKYDIPTYHVFF